MEITTEAIVSIIGLVIAIPSAAFAVRHWQRHQSSTNAKAKKECTSIELESQSLQNTLPTDKNTRSARYPRHLLETFGFRSGRVSASSVHVDTVEMI